jgi:hypothetical protein
MSTSHPATGLPRPTADEKISLGTFGYINARNRQRAYDIVIKELKKSGLTQAALASRMGKSADVVCRLLSRPQNWESDTFSSLLFAISGAIPKYGVTYHHPHRCQHRRQQRARHHLKRNQSKTLMPYEPNNPRRIIRIHLQPKSETGVSTSC